MDGAHPARRNVRGRLQARPVGLQQRQRLLDVGHGRVGDPRIGPGWHEVRKCRLHRVARREVLRRPRVHRFDDGALVPQGLFHVVHPMHGDRVEPHPAHARPARLEPRPLSRARLPHRRQRVVLYYRHHASLDRTTCESHPTYQACRWSLTAQTEYRSASRDTARRSGNRPPARSGRNRIRPRGGPGEGSRDGRSYSSGRKGRPHCPRHRCLWEGNS